MKLKKPKFWDYKKPNIFSNLLLPISKLIELKIKLSNNQKIKFNDIITICVGNIYLGGTGKTSIAVEIKKILDQQNIKSCFIKKKYSDQIDEQKILDKYGQIFINKSRIEALKRAKLENFKVAIFDDGLQDKNLTYDLSFVCFNKKNFIGNGRIIPAGPLREPLDNLVKYKNIIFTGNEEDITIMENKLRENYSNLDFYSSHYEILNLDKFKLDNNYVVFSGIGNHSTLVDMLKKNKFKLIHDFEFPDHYNYNENEINKIVNFASKNNCQILTTEKDYLRLSESLKSKIDYIKVSLEIKKIEKLRKKLIKLINNENS